MYTILMLNQKGGVGKTTIADELSFALERRGKTVAFVTTDPQGGSVHEICDDPDFAEECDFQVVDTAGVLVGGAARRISSSCPCFRARATWSRR
jgi:chromosome partitioning protein